MITISLSGTEITGICITIALAIWGLIRIIFFLYKKDYDEHKEDCKAFRAKQTEENIKNLNFRHKYDEFDKSVGKLIDQTEERLLSKLNQSINSINDSVKAVNNSVNLILEHILRKNER